MLNAEFVTAADCWQQPIQRPPLLRRPNLWCVDDSMSGDGWEVVKASPVDFRRIFTFSKLLPDAQWFWLSLERHCVAGCCGLGAFEFTHAAVRWACGDDLTEPDGYAWREEHPGDPTALAGDLREVASELKASMAPHADADIFCEPATPASYATLLELLADWLEQPLPMQSVT